MDHQENTDLKALELLTIDYSTDREEYSQKLKELFGENAHHIQKELINRELIDPLKKQYESPEGKKSLNLIVYAYRITDTGKLRYEALLKKHQDEEEEKKSKHKEGKQSTTRTSWSVITGWAALATLAATLFLIYLEYHPPHEKNAENSKTIITDSSRSVIQKSLPDSNKANAKQKAIEKSPH